MESGAGYSSAADARRRGWRDSFMTCWGRPGKGGKTSGTCGKDALAIRGVVVARRPNAAGSARVPAGCGLDLATV
jgi:hypothetical protein